MSPKESDRLRRELEQTEKENHKLKMILAWIAFAALAVAGIYFNLSTPEF